MVGRPQQRSIETRARILEAAREAFQADGFEATSVEAVARRAGVSKASVFAHFHDKPGLLIGVRIEALTGLVQDMRARAQAIAAPDPASGAEAGDPAAALAALFLPVLALYREDPEFARLFLVQSTLKDGPFTRQFLEICAAMEETVSLACRGLAAAGRLAGHDDPVLAAQGLLAFFYHAVVGHSLGTFAEAVAQEAFFTALVTRWVDAGR